MKKQLLITALGFALTGSVFAQAEAQVEVEGVQEIASEVVLDDFDSNRNLNTWIPDGGSYFVTVKADSLPVANDGDAAIFSLTEDRAIDGANWIGSRVNAVMGATTDWASYNVADYGFYQIDVYCEESFNLALKIENKITDNNKVTTAEKFLDYTADDAGAWKTLYFDLSSADTATDSDNELLFLIDIFNEETAKEIYFDNFKATTTNVGLLNSTVAQKALNTYPNPATNVLNIDTELSNYNELNVYNMVGELVMTKAITSGQLANGLDVSSLDAGVYTLNISNESEQTSVKFTVIK